MFAGTLKNARTAVTSYSDSPGTERQEELDALDRLHPGKPGAKRSALFALGFVRDFRESVENGRRVIRYVHRTDGLERKWTETQVGPRSNPWYVMETTC